MTEIQNFFIGIFNARQNSGGDLFEDKQTTPSFDKIAPKTKAKIIQHMVKDRIYLSKGGQNIVNLARGNDLANEFRNAPVDKDYTATLTSAFEDIFRIVRLFTETFKNAFSINQEKNNLF